MKTGSGISKPVLLLAAVAMTVTALLVWRAGPWRQSTASQPDAEASAVTVSPAEAKLNSSEAASSPGLANGSLPPVIPISLVNYLTKAENVPWVKEPTYLAMPRGTQNFGGIEFWIDGVMQLRSGTPQGNGNNYRTQMVVPLTVTNLGAAGMVDHGSNVACIYLFGAARNAVETGMKIADLTWRYTDGSSRRIPVHYLNQVRDYARVPYEEPARLPYQYSKVVWKVKHPTEPGSTLRLYRMGFANPLPDKVVKQLEFTSALVRPRLFFLALTLDPVPLGARPDDSPDLEGADDEPANTLQLVVQDGSSRPVGGANVKVTVRHTVEGKSGSFTKTSTTDAFGNYRVTYPLHGVERLEVAATHEDYGGRKMSWETKAGDQIPSTYVLKLNEALTLSGVVVDPQTNGVAGVNLEFYRFWSGGEEMVRKGEDFEFSRKSTTTDPNGHWQLRGVPKLLADLVSGVAKHPDYLPADLSCADEKTLAQLTAGTHVTHLTAGIVVYGRVLDGTDQPIPSATVSLSRKYYRERQETKTDAEGRFSFKNVKAERTPLSVVAKGYAPESRDVSVKSGLEEQVFRLRPGSVLRALVQNAGGEPLPDVRVVLAGHGPGVNQDQFEFSTKTDGAGRFEWDGAPTNELRFYFYKSGYEQKREVALQAGRENIVTLKAARKIEGFVVDADTGQPIPKFSVGLGEQWDLNGPLINARMKDLADPSGAFSLTSDEEKINAIKAVAEDYTEKIERLVKEDTGTSQVTLRLKRSPAVRAILVSPEGTPVAGATVGVTFPDVRHRSMTLRRGKLTSFSGEKGIVVTDSNGEFTLASPPDTGGMVVAADPSGFAMAPLDQVRNSGRLMLQPLGRIEGSIRLLGQPAAGQEFMLGRLTVGVDVEWGDFKAVSDEQGKFVMEKVPAGEAEVVRLLKTSESSWTHAQTKSVKVESGQTAQVAFGESGAVLKGQVRMEVPPGEGESVSYMASLATKMPEQPQFKTTAEAAAFYSSPEWKETIKQIKTFGGLVNRNGGLSLDSIPPGTYTLSVNAFSGTPAQYGFGGPLAMGSTTVVVPDNIPANTSIDIPEIVLRPVNQPRVAK